MADEIEIIVHLDRALGVQIPLQVARSATGGSIKRQLAEADPTGETDPFSFCLKRPLPSGEVLGEYEALPEGLRELDCCIVTEDEPEAAAMEPVAPAAETVAPGPTPPSAPKTSSQPSAPKTSSQAIAVSGTSRWEVVGGGEKGGILVRSGQDLASSAAATRLATGAVIEELELIGERLHYRLQRGDGPQEGWVSLRLSGKDLVQKMPDDEGFDKWHVLKRCQQGGPGANATDDAGAIKEDALRAESAKQILSAAEASVSNPYAVLNLEPGTGSHTVRKAYHILSLLHHPDKGGDARVFQAITKAYRVLSESKDASDNSWRDLEGQAVGPWAAHDASMMKGVTCCLFDSFGLPPWESRRLYTGSYNEASIRCWELSKAPLSSQGVKPPPRLIGEIQVGGFLNAAAQISPFGLITCQSAGMKPMPGESMRQWNLKKTPFKPLEKKKLAALTDANRAPASSALQKVQANEDEQLAERDEERDEEAAQEELDKSNAMLLDSKMVYLHHRGVRCISLWPPVDGSGSTPAMAATVSKDVLAVSNIAPDALELQLPPIWRVNAPHGASDVNALRHETAHRLWTGNNHCVIKCWDITRGERAVMEFDPGCTGQCTGMEIWPQWNALVVATTSGLANIDIRTGQMAKMNYTQEPVFTICSLGPSSHVVFAGIGRDLMQYDARALESGLSAKLKVVASWSLGSPITSVTATRSGKGHILVAAGCMNGKVAAFDTT